MSDSKQPHGLQPTRLLHPWDFPGKSTGVGCHCLLQNRDHSRTTIWSSNSIYGYIPKSIESKLSKRYFHTYVHSSIMHNSQDVEATQISINRWVDKQNVASTYNGILYSLEKEWNPITGYNMDKPWGHYYMWNKLVTKRLLLYDSTYMR